MSSLKCVAMNRSLTNVLFGGIGAPAGVDPSERKMEGSITKATVDDAVDALTNANSVIITPGYGLAVAKAQFEISEIARLLKKRGVQVRFGVHPVAGKQEQVFSRNSRESVADAVHRSHAWAVKRAFG